MTTLQIDQLAEGIRQGLGYIDFTYIVETIDNMFNIQLDEEDEQTLAYELSIRGIDVII